MKENDEDKEKLIDNNQLPIENENEQNAQNINYGNEHNDQNINYENNQNAQGVNYGNDQYDQNANIENIQNEQNAYYGNEQYNQNINYDNTQYGQNDNYGNDQINTNNKIEKNDTIANIENIQNKQDNYYGNAQNDNENDNNEFDKIDTIVNIENIQQKQNIYYGKEQNDDDDSKEPDENRVRRMTSFEAELARAVKKEEEEQRMKRKLAEKSKIKKQLILYNLKDYLFMFGLLMSPVINFNYLYLVNIIIAIIYFFFVEKLTIKAKKTKFLCEVFSVGYSSYLFLYKVICLILINNKNISLIKNHQDTYIDFGISYLRVKGTNTTNEINNSYYFIGDGDENGSLNSFYFIATFLSEIFVVIISGLSLLISFTCRSIEEEDRKFKEIKMLTLRKMIILPYIFIVIFSLFNVSFLSLLLIIFMQFIFLLNSIRITEKSVKAFYHIIVYFSIISLFIVIVLTNILNIPSIKHSIYKEQEEKIRFKNCVDKCKIYSIFTQIGIQYAHENNKHLKIVLDFFSYLCAVLLLMTLYFIHIELKSGLNIKTEEEVAKLKKLREMDIIKKTNDNNNNPNGIKNNNNSNIENNKLDLKSNKSKVKVKVNVISIFPFKINFHLIFPVSRFINYLISHPNFNYEIERIISILWTYYY